MNWADMDEREDYAGPVSWAEYGMSAAVELALVLGGLLALVAAFAWLVRAALLVALGGLR